MSLTGNSPTYAAFTVKSNLTGVKSMTGKPTVLELLNGTKFKVIFQSSRYRCQRYSGFTVKSVGVNETYRYCGVEDSAMPVTVLVFFL